MDGRNPSVPYPQNIFPSPAAGMLGLLLNNMNNSYNNPLAQLTQQMPVPAHMSNTGMQMLFPGGSQATTTAVVPLEPTMPSLPTIIPSNSGVDAGAGSGPVSVTDSDSDSECDAAAEGRASGSRPAKARKGKKAGKTDSPWANVQASVLLKLEVLVATAEATKTKGASLSPEEVDTVFEQTRTGLLSRLEAGVAGSPKGSDESRRLKAHIESIQKLSEVKMERGGSWNQLVWTWIQNVANHGVAKARKEGKYSAAAVQDEEQREKIGKAVDTIRRFSDLGHGLAGVETIKPAQLQQQALREAAHKKRKAAEERKEDQRQKQSRMMEEVVEITKEKAGQQGDICAQIARSNELMQRDIELKSDIVAMLRSLVATYVEKNQQQREGPL
ncbi:hypothetical protein PLESTM_000469600 [Pleodorina starrii]|nr:hypothetical protein PLESTM_000469600 [Pleodorina starrii]